VAATRSTLPVSNDPPAEPRQDRCDDEHGENDVQDHDSDHTHGAKRNLATGGLMSRRCLAPSLQRRGGHGDELSSRPSFRELRCTIALNRDQEAK
jgi:hypothetical protein